MSGILGDYTEDFLEESEDQIEELNSNLLKLEQNHNDPEIINDIFRAAHSLKSSSAFVGLYNLSDLAHKMENLLQKIREGKLGIQVTLVNLLFECFDLIKEVIDAVGKGYKEERTFEEMIQKLGEYEKSHASEGNPSVTSAPKSKAPEPTPEPVIPKVEEVVVSTNIEPFTPLSLEESETREIEEEIKVRNGKAFDIRVVLKKETPMKGLRFTLILQNLKLYAAIYKCFPDMETLERGIDQNFINFIIITQLEETEIKKLIQVDMVEYIDVVYRNIQPTYAQSKSEQAVSEAKKERAVLLDKESDKALSKSIKVSSEKLDQLMNNVGELVITNSGFQKIYDDLVRNFGDDTIFSELKSKIDQINRISKDLQTGIMNTRMVPIGTVFNRFSRLVRDLSVETSKKVQLILLGENTELDKKVVDMIGEPLMHLIRNSIDHGIETPEERLKAGKPEFGTVELNAYQGGNNIMVEIKDDGRGLNKARILKKALDNGLVTQSEVNNLTDNDIYQFIFAAGFSTAAQVTDISGRGVGMNVVNKLIQDFKGKILINTSDGFGTSFTLCFPQALAIIPSILVSMEEEIYAFPLSEVFETIRIKKEQINTLEGHEIINLRGEVLPIYRLDRIIGLSERPGREESPVVIVNYNSRKLGFIVDELIGKHETVIKTLEKNYKNIKGLTGASIMGDGTIILVLDIGGLIDITGNIVRDQSGLTGEEMLRLNESYVTDINSSATIYKTKNATNIFNQSLLQLKQQDKSRKKKEKSDRKKVVIQKDYSTEEIAKQEEEIQTEKEPVVQEIQSEVQKENPYIVKEDTQAQDDILNDELEEAIPVDITEEMDEREKAKEMLKSFSEQTKKRVEDLITTDRPINEIMSKEEIRKLESVVNTGMMNAGLVLSQLVGSNVELFMPEITLMDADELSNQIRDSNENFFGMKVRMNGDLNGNLLMVFSEAKGRELADKLLKSNESSDLAKKISEDSLSVLMEISNIVCASVMNSLSNKAKAQIMPSVPELITGTFKQVIEFVKPERTKFLTMNTEFIYEGDNLIGNLIFLPDFDELVKLISKLS
jgi:two-component system chemotaxis sensor kinase CheA